MGTREVYEEKLRSGNLYHEPTINPGLGSARCPRCLSLLNPNSWIWRKLLSHVIALSLIFCVHEENPEWTITSVLHDMTAVAGFGAGAMLGAVHGFNTGIPFVQKHVKGSKWLQFLVGVPSLLLFSGACSALGGYAVPEFAQLSVTSYYKASSFSHYAVSQATRCIEERHTSRNLREKSG